MAHVKAAMLRRWTYGEDYVYLSHFIILLDGCLINLSSDKENRGELPPPQVLCIENIVRIFISITRNTFGELTWQVNANKHDKVNIELNST